MSDELQCNKKVVLITCNVRHTLHTPFSCLSITDHACSKSPRLLLERVPSCFFSANTLSPSQMSQRDKLRETFRLNEATHSDILDECKKTRMAFEWIN